MTGPTQFDPTIGGSAPAGVSPPDLPSAPEFERRVKFRRAQLIGVLALTVVPIVGAFGWLGPTVDSVSGFSESVSVHVEYPAVQRFKMRLPLRVEVTNTSQEARLIEVELRSDYLTAFSDVAITPGPDRIDNDVYVFELGEVETLRTRVITLEMQAQHFGSHEGHVQWRLTDEAGTSIDIGTLEFTTIILP